MTIKVYISGICGSHEVRKQQQRVLFILQSLPIDLKIVDITEPGRENDLVFMQDIAKKHNKETQLPPQIFNEEEYCGDYSDFELANDDDEIMQFLKLEDASKKDTAKNTTVTGEAIKENGFHETSKESDILDQITPNEVTETNLESDNEYSKIGEEETIITAEENITDNDLPDKDEVISKDLDVEKELVDSDTKEEKANDEEEKAKESPEEEESEEESE